MADIIDQGNDAADFILRVELQNQKHAAKKATPGIGLCLNCGADVEGDRRWCDAECRDQWQSEQNRR